MASSRLLLALIVLAGLLGVRFAASAAEVRTPDAPPHITIPAADATVQAVTVETYGTLNEYDVRRYLSVQPGAPLAQATVDADYENLVKLGGYRVRLDVIPGAEVQDVTLHWIVMNPWFKLTAHPVYEEAPLSDPTRGVGFVVTPLALGKRGANFSLVTSQNRWSHHYYATLTAPIQVNPTRGRESDLIVNGLRDQDAYRISSPQSATIYNWTSAGEVQYLVRGTSGTQFEIGMRQERSTSSRSSGIVAPSLYPSSTGAAKNLIAEIGLSHACPPGPTGGWYPPYCHTQYRTIFLDGVGGAGSTSVFQAYLLDVAQYVPIHTSTLALHVQGARTGGVIPESRLPCAAALRAFPQPFCGTDGTLLQAEYRIRDAAVQPLKFTLFTETGSHRVRGGNQPWAPSTYQWHADSGLELRYRGVTIDLAHGSDGYRLNLGLSAQTF